MHNHRPGTVSHHVNIVIQGDVNVTPEELLRLKANHRLIETQVQEAANDIIKRVARAAQTKPKVEPGLPLRQFVRGFLRDHLGFSKIMAHHAADLFMKRWQERDEKRAKRYAREDQHTEEATRDRKAAEWLDQNTERL